jgi:hypothetical protein
VSETSDVQGAQNALEQDAERVARAFHETYERLAPHYGYDTREASARPWSQVPDNNRNLMIATSRELLRSGLITVHSDNLKCVCEWHDDQTMRKVYNALIRSGLDHDAAMNAINEMQNAGILFREMA